MNALRASAVLFLLPAACSHSEWPTGSTTATLFGPDARLDGWTTSVVDGIHVHSARPEEPCEAASAEELTSAISAAVPEKSEQARDLFKEMGKNMGRLMEMMIARSRGPAYGGAGRTVVALRRAASDESILIDLPLLPPAEKERTFRAGEVKAVYEHPARTAGARLARGWVRAVRLDSGGIEYDLFLVLKPERPDAAYETMQVITRVAWPPR